MKYLMTAALATAAFFMVQAADSFFRTDLDGRKNHIELMPGSNDSVKAENPMRDGEAQRESSSMQRAKQNFPAQNGKNMNFPSLLPSPVQSASR